MIKYGRALYYPSVTFRDLNWFKLSTLFYEGLDRIVPDSDYHFFIDQDEVKRINDSIGYVRNINPKEYRDSATEKYLDFLEKNLKSISDVQLQEIISTESRYYSSIHHSKLDKDLRYELAHQTLVKHNNEYYTFDYIFGYSHRSFLANEIGSQKKIPVISDYEQDQFALNAAQIDTKIIKDDVAFNLANLVIESYMPENIEQVSIKQLIEFRKKHKAERIRFYNSINELVKDLDNITNKDTLDDILNFRKKEIDASVKELKLSLKGLGISVYEGLLGVSLPSALQLLPNENEYSSFIKGFGSTSILVVLGAKSYIDKRRIKQDNPYSYLLSLDKSKLGKEKLHKLFIKGKILT